MKIHQNYVTMLAAVGFALLVLVANIFLQAPDGKMRMGFAAALYLVSRDTLAGASIARGARTFRNPDRWVYAFYLALFFGSFMLLALWRGREGLPDLLLPIAAGASLFGLLMAFFLESPPYPYAHHFQTETTKAPGPVRRFFYYLNPPLKLLIIWLLVLNSPQSTAYLFFYIILIGFMGPRYARKKNGNMVWAYFPYIAGTLLLFALLLAFR